MIIYCTSITQPWKKVNRYACALSKKQGANLKIMPARLNPYEQYEWIDKIIDHSEKNFVVASMEEAPILRILRRIREGKIANIFTVHCLLNAAFGEGVQIIRSSDDGEFIDLWQDGFFDHRMQEIF